jgi:hypothetical protein
MPTSCTILVEPLADGRFRATCHLFPDCEVIAPNEEAARRGFEAVIGAVLRGRDADGSDPGEL